MSKLQIINGFLYFSVVSLAFMVTIFLDHIYDEHTCATEFLSVLDGVALPRAYANDDFFKINFGSGIACSVFWEEFEGSSQWLTSVDFESGALDMKDIENARYWKSDISVRNVSIGCGDNETETCSLWRREYEYDIQTGRRKYIG